MNLEQHIANRKIELTAGQQDLAGQLDIFLGQRDVRVFLMKGYAGTGKTFMLTLLAGYLEQEHRVFRLMAPTGRAARLLARRAHCEAHTIHKSIYSLDRIEEVQRDQDDYHVVFGVKTLADEEMNTALIVDESSMVGDVASRSEFLRFGSGRLLTDLLAHARIKVPGLPSMLILAGDGAQLLPVGDRNSPALDVRYLQKEHGLACMEHELTDVVRQAADSAIYRNATAIRDTLRSRQLNRLNLAVQPGEVEEITGEVPGRIYDICLDRDHGRVARDRVLVTYSNEEALCYNKMLRSQIYGLDGEGPLQKGDLLIVHQNCATYGLFNGDFVTVHGDPGPVETRSITLRGRPQVTLQFRDVTLCVRNEQEQEATLLDCKIVENLLMSPDRDLTREQQIALYIDFKKRNPGLKPNTAAYAEALRLDPYFNALRVKYGYAITCHKAQGGEWPVVIVKFGGFGGWDNEAYFRWCYTAITRAKERLFVINPPRYRNSLLRPPMPVPAGTGPVAQTEPGPDQDDDAALPGTETEITADDVTQVLNEMNDYVVEPDMVPDGRPVSPAPSSPAATAPQGTAGPGAPATGGAEPERWAEQFAGKPDYLLQRALALERELAGKGIRLVKVEHLQWAERYLVGRGATERACFQASYNSKGAFRQPQAVAMHGASQALLAESMAAFAALPPAILAVPAVKIAAFPADRPFLREQYEELCSALQPAGIRIVGLEHRNYAERYHFQRDGQVVDMVSHYNAKGRFTASQILTQPGIADALAAELRHLIINCH